MNTRKVVCLTNTKDGSITIMPEDKFHSYVERTPGCTLKDGILYYEHEKIVPYYNSVLGNAIIKELKKDTPVAAFFRALVSEVSEASYNFIGADALEEQLKHIGKRFHGYAPEIHAVSGYKTIRVTDTYSVEEATHE